MSATPPPAGEAFESVSAAAERVRAILRGWARHDRRAVIFDFNGTLSDDEGILLEIFVELFRTHLGWTLTAEDYFGRFAGHSDREIVELAVAEHSAGEAELVEELLRRRRELYKLKVADRSPIGPGAVQLVQRLAHEGVPMAIVTGAQREDVECVLTNSPVGQLIGLMVTEEDVSRGKPDPEGFHVGAKTLGVPPEAILVFEDSVPGVTAALAAGMRCVAVHGRNASAQLERLAGAGVPELSPAILDLEVGATPGLTRPAN